MTEQQKQSESKEITKDVVDCEQYSNEEDVLEEN